jgi:hypothetical protein
LRKMNPPRIERIERIGRALDGPVVRELRRDSDVCPPLCVCVCVCVCKYIYIYIYIYACVCICIVVRELHTDLEP